MLRMPNDAHDEAASSLGAHMAAELSTQPQNWATAADIATTAALPEHGARVAVIGCGTSWFTAQAYASLRNTAGLGLTDAYQATEVELGRGYDAVVAITRSGTTSEVLRVIDENAGRVPVYGIVGDGSSPFATAVDHLVPLSFADERSVVQTRFATSVLALLRAHLGESLDGAIADAERMLAVEIDDDLVQAEQIAFLGTGWTLGLAHEAALKNREASQSWTESYLAMDYRHGPISIARPGRATWVFGAAPEGLGDEVRGLGATFVEHPDTDPLAQLVYAHRIALARARARDLDPDVPRGLSRAVILN